MPRLPQISGRELIRLLESLGYESLRNVGATCDYVEFRQRVNKRYRARSQGGGQRNAERHTDESQYLDRPVER